MASFKTACILILYFICFAGALENSTRLGWVSEPEGRGTTSLLWSCLSTLFICLWASLHLNIPAEDDSATTRFFRKLKWTCISAVAPELVSAVAFMQWRASCKDVKRIRQAGLEQWTQVHCFYANMGGIQLKVGDCPEGQLSRRCSPKVIVHAHEIYRLAAEGFIPSDVLSVDAIRDKSKADNFVKSVACMQATWLIAQCIGRAAQSLPITTLELSTLAYILYAITNYALWWKKPLDVGTPTVIDISDKMANGHHRHVSPHVYPLLGGMIATGKRIPNDCGYGFFAESALFPMIICCIIFGGVHCIGWNFSYPSPAEKLLWRISCLLSMFIPPQIALTMYLFDRLNFIHFNLPPSISAPFKIAAKKVTYWRKANPLIEIFVAFLLVSCHCFARIYLILEVFINLRSAPAECYRTVNWSKFLPHIA